MGSHDSRLTTSHPPYVSPDARGCPSAVRHSDSSTVPQPASLTQLSLRHGLALARFWCPTDLNVIDSDRRFVEGPGTPFYPTSSSESFPVVSDPSQRGPKSVAGCCLPWLTDKMGLDVRLQNQAPTAASSVRSKEAVTSSCLKLLVR